MTIALVVLIFAALAALIFGSIYKRRKEFQSVCRDLGVTYSKLLQNFESEFVIGKISGKTIELSRSSSKNQHEPLYEKTIFSLYPESLIGGNRIHDREFVISSNTQEDTSINVAPDIRTLAQSDLFFTIHATPETQQIIRKDKRCMKLLLDYFQTPWDSVQFADNRLTVSRTQVGGPDRQTTSLLMTALQQWELLQALASAIDPVMVATRALPDESIDCPFCRDAIGAADIMECSSCKTLYHEACWTEHGGACSIFGCSGSGIKIVTPQKLTN